MTHILVVDDDPVICLILERILRKSIGQVTSAVDGEQALNFLAKYKFDLIITDLMMPNMDGLTMLERLRSDTELQHLPVIVVTAASQMRYQQQAAQLGVRGFLTKPFSSAELKQIVINTLQKPQTSHQGYAS